MKQFIAIIMSFCTFPTKSWYLGHYIPLWWSSWKRFPVYIEVTCAFVVKFLVQIHYAYCLSHFPRVVSCSLHTLTFRSGWNACSSIFRSTHTFRSTPTRLCRYAAALSVEWQVRDGNFIYISMKKWFSVLWIKINVIFVYSVTSVDIDRVSGWLLLNANSAIFQLCHGENKLIFNEMMMRSALF